MRAPSVPGTGIDRLRLSHLQPTLEHAATQVPYYRKRWGTKWKRVRRLEDLRLLPLLTKDEAIAPPQADGSRVIAMNIGAGALMALTAWLHERGDDPRRFRVRELSTYGFRLSPHWRAHVEAAWGARVFDNFSLSEVKTPAVECAACGFFHWLEPPLIFD